MSTEQDKAVAEARRILQDAGFVPGGGPTFADAAAQALMDHEQARAEQAEREAEDAKVAAYRLHQYKAQNRFPDPAHESADWGKTDDETKDLWRTEYRAAREFFANEPSSTAEKLSTPIDLDALEDEVKPEPRVIQHGDSEPDRSTKWIDQDGDTVSYHDGLWRAVDRNGVQSGSTTWPGMASIFFPMTEVVTS